MTTDSLFHYSNFFDNTGVFIELMDSCMYPWEVLPRIDDFILNFSERIKENGYEEIRKDVFIGKDVVIDDTARIEGKVIIGHGATIGHCAYLRGSVLLGEGVHVGHAVEVKHSILFSGTALAHLNYVGDSIVGSNCNISGGVILANWRFDRQNIVIKNIDEVIPTNMEKMGGIIGDDSFIGVNSVINPGTVLAKKTLVFPLISVKGTHLDSSTIK